MIKKIIDGVEIICSPEEEALFIQKWAMNDANPHFAGNLMFDGVNAPSYNMDGCKKTLQSFLNQASDKYIKDLTNQIQMADEDENSVEKASLLAQRKAAREFPNIDISMASDVDFLKSLIPSELLIYWGA